MIDYGKVDCLAGANVSSIIPRVDSKLCALTDNPVNVVFPAIVTLSFPSKLYVNLEIFSLTVKFNGISDARYVLFSTDRSEMLGGVDSSF